MDEFEELEEFQEYLEEGQRLVIMNREDMLYKLVKSYSRKHLDREMEEEPPEENYDWNSFQFDMVRLEQQRLRRGYL